MENQNKSNWFEEHKFTVVILIMIFVWGSLLWYFVSYAEQIGQDPCGVCSERMGQNVFCTTQETNPSTRTYFPNGSIKETVPKRINPMANINFTLD